MQPAQGVIYEEMLDGPGSQGAEALGIADSHEPIEVVARLLIVIAVRIIIS